MAPPTRLDPLAILSNLFVSSTPRRVKKIGAAATFLFFYHTIDVRMVKNKNVAAVPIFYRCGWVQGLRSRTGGGYMSLFPWSSF